MANLEQKQLLAKRKQPKCVHVKKQSFKQNKQKVGT